MTRQDVIDLLVGKTIESIKHGNYMGWFTIREIKFTDGSYIELSGRADEAMIDPPGITLANGRWIEADEDTLDKYI